MSLDITLKMEEEYVFEANITHNLDKMASEAGIYDLVWRPDEVGITFAKELIPGIEKGLIDLVLKPEHYKQFNAENGWGTYKSYYV